MLNVDKEVVQKAIDIVTYCRMQTSCSDKCAFYDVLKGSCRLHSSEYPDKWNLDKEFKK